MRADHFAAIDRAELDPGHGVNRVLYEVNRAIAEEGIGPAPIPAPRPGERASFLGWVVAFQAARRVAYAPEPERCSGKASSAKLANSIRPNVLQSPPNASGIRLRFPAELSMGRSPMRTNSPVRSRCGACRCGHGRKGTPTGRASRPHVLPVQRRPISHAAGQMALRRCLFTSSCFAFSDIVLSSPQHDRTADSLRLDR